MIYVNQEKLKRAQEILGFITGKLVPQSDIEVERKQRFHAHLTAAKIPVDDKKALEFVYEKLGGLVRTEEEQASFVEKVKKSIKKK
jgi:hypothetical protein